MKKQTEQQPVKYSSRNIIIAASLLIAAHATILVFWGTRPPGPLLSDLFQLGMGAFCVLAAFQASRRSDGIARYFWGLTAITFSLFVVAQALGWYDNAFQAPHFIEWFVNLLFFFWLTPLGMALFLDPDFEPKGFDWLLILDLGQVILFWLAGYFYFFYIPSQSQSGTALTHSIWAPYFVYNGFLIGAFFLRSVLTKSGVARALFGRMTVFLLFAGSADFSFYYGPWKDLQTGGWYDFVWISANFLVVILAATWKQMEPSRPIAAAPIQPHSSLVTQLLPLVYSLLILVISAQIATERLKLAATVVLISFAASSVRLLITQHRQERGRRLLEVVIEGTTDAIFVKDCEGRYLMINTAGAGRMGREVKEVIAKTDGDLLPAETGRQIMEKDRQVLQSGGSETSEEMGTAGGATRTYLATKGPYRDARGKVAGLFGISRDITERKSMEENLKVQKAFLEQLIESAPEAIAIVDPDYTIRRINLEFTRVFGYTPDEACGQNLTVLIVPADKMEESRALEYHSERASTTVLETTRHRKDRSRVNVSVLVSPVMVGKGLDAVYCIYRDISDRKTIEEQLRQSQKMEAIGRLAGGVAHDLNNLLTVITGYSELQLASITTNNPVYGPAEQIKLAADRASTLTRQLLAFSRRQVLQPRVINLNAVVDAVESLLRRLIGEDVVVILNLAPDLGTVRADPGQMEQVIMNLAVNARDAMPQGGKLLLETANAELDDAYARGHVGVQPGRYILLSISDTGKGMDENTLAHIFEPFFTTKETGKGTGLGLSTVYGIVQQSNGHIWVYSEPGKGTSFKIYLPRVQEAAAPNDGRRHSTQKARGNETVLLVEDDPQVRELTRTLLADCGYSVLAVEQPSEVEKLCREHHGTIHLLLTDVIMPGMTGKEVAVVVQQLCPGIRVLYMSGYTDTIIDHHGGLGPETFFLQKPFTSAALSDKVRQVLG
jgi:PAS domain S-box-containing protein